MRGQGIVWGGIFVIIFCMHTMWAGSLGFENTTPFAMTVRYRDSRGHRQTIELKSGEKRTFMQTEERSPKSVIRIESIRARPADGAFGLSRRGARIDFTSQPVPVFSDANKKSAVSAVTFAQAQAQKRSATSVLYLRIVLDGAQKTIMIEPGI